MDQSGIKQLLSELDRLAWLFEHYERKLAADGIRILAYQITVDIDNAQTHDDADCGNDG